ncbi:MAG TPA: methylated-DNA--[protein]-cysteine S-methyltransferase [Pusillimonas sp.]
MKTHLHPSLRYNFRTPGSVVGGPIRYAIGSYAQDLVLVGHSGQGICAIFLGEDAHALQAQLAGAFPGVPQQEDVHSLRGDLNKVIAFLQNDKTQGCIDLDVGGTAFQQKVWQALCAIPAGQTRSYTQVAQGLGIPRAVRAVASACAANVLAIAVPCHRVLRSDGSISGYRWGVERKRALLEKENG